MFCEYAVPSDASTRWVTSSYTKFGKGLQSLETYTATVFLNAQGTPSPITVTTSGPFLASDIRGSGTGVLWGMAVLITSTVSFFIILQPYFIRIGLQPPPFKRNACC